MTITHKKTASGDFHPPKGQLKTDCHEIVADQVAENKRIQNAIAVLALHGFATYEMSDGAFVVSNWQQSKSCPDARSLVTLAKTLEVSQ